MNIWSDEIRSHFKNFIEQQLNAEQAQAVHPQEGVLLVCAGAGSGKTRVITARIVNLILNHNVPSSSILALTFTNKAAREMKERVASFLSSHEQLPYVGTFHAYALRFLKMHRHALGYPEFSILDDSDQEKLLRGLLTQHGLQKKITPKSLSSTIGRLKNDSQNGLIDYSQLQNPQLEQIIRLYEQEKVRAHCLDFDDLLLTMLRVLKTNPSIKERHQEMIRHILIDEYQDTNHVQHALLKELSCNKDFTLDSLCVVGDEDQSIYSWRGATVDNIIGFNHDFPQTQYVSIAQNYRSVSPILDVANYIIGNNNRRNPKKLWSARAGRDRVRILSCMSSYQEGDVIALCAQHKQKQGKLSEVAVLYRSHYQSRSIEEALIRYSIPYKIVGGIQFYDRQEIKDLFAYMRLVVNPFDRVSFMRVVNVPSRGLGDKFEEQFLQCWNEHVSATFIDVAQYIIKEQLVTKIKQLALQEFIAIFNNLSATQTAQEVLNTLITRTGYLSYLKKIHEEEADTKIENVKELLHAVTVLHETQNISTVAAFLDEVALLQESIAVAKDERDCVLLMTLHAAKGLEFNTVFITGLEEGIFPSSHAMYSPEALEEERRLLYVGITRACEYLVMTHARHRYQYGSMSDQVVSRFLDEVPPSLDRQDITKWFHHQISAYFQQWLNSRGQTIEQAPILLSKKPAAQSTQWLNDDPFSEDKPIISATRWKENQKVHHPTFGPGVIEDIETRANQKVILTIRFPSGRKKLDSSFVK